MSRAAPRRSLLGVSLVEVAAAVAVIGVVAAIVWPSQQAQLHRARRADAITALTRMQHAQEQHRLRFGRYATDFAALAPAPRLSPEGLYELSIGPADADRVTLLARAQPDRPQHSDRNCVEITLTLNQGLAEPGPNSHCWNR